MEHVSSNFFSFDKKGTDRKATLLGIPEVWVRFLLAIVGLCLAFAAALFSTVSRDAGSLWGTVILASLALMLATTVGLTTVPYLARRVAVARVRDAFDYQVTRAGIVYFFAVLVIGIAALNTGNNLLYIILASMLAAILVSGIASAMALSNLELDVQLPNHIFAGENAQGRILLRNPRRYFPSFSVSVVSAPQENATKRWRWVRSSFGVPLGQPPEQQWVKIADWKLKRVLETPREENILQEPAYFPFITAGSYRVVAPGFCFSRRGLFQQKSFGLSTLFPFAFLKKTRSVPSGSEIVVYPRLLPVEKLIELIGRIDGEIESFARGNGVELHSIRDGVPEDSYRHVDWKATAKSRSLKVREFTQDDELKLRIVFDNPAQGALDDSAYEAMVQTAGSISWYFAKANARISFVAQGFEGDANIFDFMKYLSSAAPRSVLSASARMESSGSILPSLPESTAFNVIFTAEPASRIPASLWRTSRLIFPEDFLH
jgi:uncharacterized protein (DUF58 family)